MKVSELTGAQLDYWVARAIAEGFCEIAGFEFFNAKHADGSFHYSTDWSLAGPIIERERISVTFPEIDPAPGFEWHANIAQPDESFNQYGPTPLIAAMRAYVTSKYGEEVPDEVQSGIKLDLPPAK